MNRVRSEEAALSRSPECRGKPGPWFVRPPAPLTTSGSDGAPWMRRSPLTSIKAHAGPGAYPASMSAPAASPALLPREHGAYVQLGLALTCGLILGQGQFQAWSQTLLTVALFLASAPALFLVGTRGTTVPPQTMTRALKLLAVFALLALLLAVLAWREASLFQARSLLVPTLLAAVLGGLALAKRAHTTLGELVAAWALSSSAYPVATLGGAENREAVALTLALAAVHTLGTAIVRAFLESLKRRGRPWPRVIPPVLGGLLAGLALAAGQTALALALVPGTVLAASLLVHPPAPRHMKRLGWMLTAASAAGMVPVLLALA